MTALERDRRRLDVVVVALPLSGRVARAGAALAADAEGADLLSHRRHRRRADHVAARTARRRAQLGLSLLLAARCDLHAAGADACRLSRGGAGLGRLAAPQRRRHAVADPDAVRPGRRALADGVGGAVARRLRRRAAGAHRQRRERAVAARRLRRADGCAVSGDASRPGAARTRAGTSSAQLVTHLAEIWDQPDESIWEVRGGQRHFTFSKAMAWVAMDRAIRGAEEFELPGRLEQWRALRQQIHDSVCREGYNAEKNSFVQYYGGDALDASLLLLPLVGFLPPEDPRIKGTVAAIQRELTVDGLVLRYRTHEARRWAAAGRGRVPRVQLLAGRQSDPARPQARGARAVRAAAGAVQRCRAAGGGVRSARSAGIWAISRRRSRIWR